VASELKALEGLYKIQLFPGHYMTSKDGEFVQWYKRWTDYGVKDNETNIQDIKVALEAAVHRQLMSDVPYIVFWRLDSSITSAVKNMRKRIESGDA
jgi:asparagine synthase (glutamine-hydrolysing)